MNKYELEQLIWENPELIEGGLKVIERQKKIDNGVIDLFCKDKDEKYVLIELKIKPAQSVLTQIAKYKICLEKQGIPKEKLRCILVTVFLDEQTRQLCCHFGIEAKELSFRDDIQPSEDFCDLEDTFYIGYEETQQRKKQVEDIITQKELSQSEARVLRAILEFNILSSYPTYEDLSKVLDLNEGTIRGTISSLATREVPIFKRKNKRNAIFLRIDYKKLPNFKPYDPLDSIKQRLNQKYP